MTAVLFFFKRKEPKENFWEKLRFSSVVYENFPA
jgi:hypothetical protein